VSEAAARLAVLWQRGRDRSLPAMCLGLAIAALLVSLLLPGVLRALVSLPILVFAPGYALQFAFGRRVRNADPWLTIGLSLVLSLALLPLILLLLYVAYRPLDAAAIVVAVTVVTLALAAVGAWLHPDGAAEDEGLESDPWLPARSASLAVLVAATLGRGGLELMGRSGDETDDPGARAPRLPLRALAAAAVLLGTGAVIALTWAILPGSSPARYSAIALSGAWSRVHRVTVVAPGKEVAVSVRVENHTATTQRYRIVPRVLGASWTAPSITLAAGRSWTGTVTGSIPTGGCLHRLLIALRCQNNACTQSLVLWLAPRANLPPSCSTATAGA
jgi:Protein of unknown function (DUF1616)